MRNRLSSTESFMWSLGQDPNLASTMGMINILEGEPEPDRLRATVGNLVASVERLRVKVNDPLGFSSPIGGLEWVVDDQFDLDHHLRTFRLTGAPFEPDSRRLRELATQFINDPFDRTRPLWQFLLITGLTDERAALVGKFHHSISDGMGIVRLAAHLLEFEPDAPAPDPPDLDALFAAEAEDSGDEADCWRAGADRIINMVQGAVRDVPSPGRLWDLGGDALSSARAAGLKFDLGFGNESDAGAPLWANRSRNRRYASLIESLPALRATAADFEISLNDLFVGACAQAAVHYHAEYDVEVDHVLATVVINIQSDSASSSNPVDLGDGANAFLPVPIRIPGSSISAAERLTVIHDEVKAKRAVLAGHSNALDAVSSIGAFVPPPLAASIMLGQAHKVDFATSNVPGSPIPTWFAGQRIEHMLPVGPVTGTAFNITMLSYNDLCHFGIHLDPAAVADSDLLTKSIGRSFRELGVDRA